LNESWDEATASVRLSEEKIMSAFASGLKDLQYVIENSNVSIEGRFTILFDTFHKAEVTVVHAVSRIESQIERLRDMINRDTRELFAGFGAMSARLSETLLQTGKNLIIYSPEKQLARGYSIVKANGKVIRSTQDVGHGDKLDITLSDGTIGSQVL